LKPWMLRKEMFGRRIADFVVIIHTNGDKNPKYNFNDIALYTRMATIENNGDVDFYVNGGQLQPCYGTFGFDIIGSKNCSHLMAVEYYIESIKFPHSFKVKECDNVDHCMAQITKPGGRKGEMGELFPYHDGMYDVNHGCTDNGHRCTVGFDCFRCCEPYHYWWGKTWTVCGKEPCWGKGTLCGAGTTCNACCRGAHTPWYQFGIGTCN